MRVTGYCRGVKTTNLKQFFAPALLMLCIWIGVGCSSMQSRSVYHQDGPYPGVRNLSRSYPEAEWGAARYPAMLIDLPFSTALDTLALPLDSLD